MTEYSLKNCKPACFAKDPVAWRLIVSFFDVMQFSAETMQYILWIMFSHYVITGRLTFITRQWYSQWM